MAHIHTLILTILHIIFQQGTCTTFTFINRCEYTVWPAILSSSGSPALETTGFTLPAGTSRTLSAPASWSGRFWGRTGCVFDINGRGTCATGDCGSGQVECNGSGAAPPATLAEFTLNGDGEKDFYDVSLVDGFNLPLRVEVLGGDSCAPTGCVTDVNIQCPAELRVGEGEAAACRSACDAFDQPEYCCSGAFANPDTCRPTVYSQLFKSACPQSYSYAFDDATSTFTCLGAQGYAITYCPASTRSQKATRTVAPRTTVPVLQEDSWLANLAIGNANTNKASMYLVALVSLITAMIISHLLISL